MCVLTTLLLSPSRRDKKEEEKKGSKSRAGKRTCLFLVVKLLDGG